MPRAELELLSPARDADIGIAAIHHGADAVYIGGPSFGARVNAGNQVADIERLARHAHRFNARVFVTLNTILRDDELEPARQLVRQLYEAGADALIVQDMGLLELDLAPIQLHASTQTDIRTPAKARFLQDVGFSQMVLARELSLPQVRAIAAEVQGAVLEFFIHGALCVAYSGQCFISHAYTGRSANRGSCSQECRQPYTVSDSAGRIVAHEQHVLSLKDNDQSANLRALIDAGIRSFKIEGRYKDIGYVKNVTAHYRQLLDAILDADSSLQRGSSGRCSYGFVPDPQRNFNRGATDYFVNGRKIDIGAFDTPKHAGMAIGHVVAVERECFVVELADGVDELHNGDGLTWVDLQGELNGVQVNVAQPLELTGAASRPGEPTRRWRVFPNEAMNACRDLRRDTVVSRNRDVAWDRRIERDDTAERRIAVDLALRATDAGFELDIEDEDGHRAQSRVAIARQPAHDPAQARERTTAALKKLGNTPFMARSVVLPQAQAWFLPAAQLNALRRDAVEALEAARAAQRVRLPRAQPVQPPAPYPDTALTYLANIYNHRARDFYARHGVQVMAAAYESHEETGDASLMITKHCVRWSLSLCPKQAKGVTGVQGTVRAEPLTLRHGNDVLTLRFDCKPCEMHVVGRLQRHVMKQMAAEPMTFFRTRPTRSAA